MTREKWSGFLGVGIVIGLALVFAACSGQAPAATVASGSEIRTHTIMVYESPT